MRRRGSITAHHRKRPAPARRGVNSYDDGSGRLATERITFS
jgi:hypothetical protein